MEINVKMTAEEFQEFMAYQADKTIYAKQMEKRIRVPECVAASLRLPAPPCASLWSR